jgi:hypothetical protein
MIALADSMNVSIGALRNMAAEGKLTTDVIVNGCSLRAIKLDRSSLKLLRRSASLLKLPTTTSRNSLARMPL